MRVFGVEITPGGVAALSGFAGSALATAGVYALAGAGWAMLAGAAPLLALSAVLIRGLLRG